MSDAAVFDLLASCEAALSAARRSVAIARALAEGCRTGIRPPEDVVEAYLACTARDESKLAELGEKLQQCRSTLG
jgi:hypothetical protein